VHTSSVCSVACAWGLRQATDLSRGRYRAAPAGAAHAGLYGHTWPNSDRARCLGSRISVRTHTPNAGSHPKGGQEGPHGHPPLAISIHPPLAPNSQTPTPIHKAKSRGRRRRIGCRLPLSGWRTHLAARPPLHLPLGCRLGGRSRGGGGADSIWPRAAVRWVSRGQRQPASRERRTLPCRSPHRPCTSMASS